MANCTVFIWGIFPISFYVLHILLVYTVPHVMYITMSAGQSVDSVHIRTYVAVYVCPWPYSKDHHSGLSNALMCIYCTYVCMCRYVYVCTYACTVCMYVRMYVWVGGVHSNTSLASMHHTVHHLSVSSCLQNLRLWWQDFFFCFFFFWWVALLLLLLLLLLLCMCMCMCVCVYNHIEMWCMLIYLHMYVRIHACMYV